MQSITRLQYCLWESVLSRCNHTPMWVALQKPKIQYTTLHCLPRVNVSLTLVNIERRVCLDLYPLQLQPGLHRGDQTEIGDETEGTLGCLQEGDDGEVSCSGALCVGESTSDQLGDHSAGPWQRKRAVGEGGPAHPDDTLRGALQPGWRTGSPWLLDITVMRRQGGWSNPHWPLTSKSCILSSVWYNVRSHLFTFTLMTTVEHSVEMSASYFLSYSW